MRLYDLARVIRSKNAGPFTLTIDLFFSDDDGFKRVMNSPSFQKQKIASLYHVSSEAVQIHPFSEIRAIKVSLPRLVSSGAPNDQDVYGSQQHFPLGDLEI